MTQEEFAKAIYKDIVDGNAINYRKILETCDRSTITDKYWQRVSSLFDKLSNEDKETLLSIFRQVSIDSLAAFFAILDGSSFLSKDCEGLSLSDSSGSSLSGDLHDYFLEIDEETQIN